MAFRGIGDDAIKVAQAQDERRLHRLQINEQARQADMGASLAEKRLAESARQFDVGQAESTWQFDVGQTESTRQFEASQAEGARRFDTGMAVNAAKFDMQRADARQQAARGFDLATFKANMNALVDQANIANLDETTQMRRAQLGTFLAAAEQERQQMANREDEAVGAFVDGALAGAYNGGPIPVSVGKRMAKALGIPNGTVTGAIDTNGTGITSYSIDDGQGNIIQKQVPADKVYGYLLQKRGKDVADVWLENFKHNRELDASMRQIAAEHEMKMKEKETVTPSQVISGGTAVMRETGGLLADFDKANADAALLVEQRAKGFLKNPTKEQLAKIDAYQTQRKVITDVQELVNQQIISALGIKMGVSPEGGQAMGGGAQAPRPQKSYLDETERQALGVPQDHKLIDNGDGTYTLTYIDPTTGAYKRERLADNGK